MLLRNEKQGTMKKQAKRKKISTSDKASEQIMFRASGFLFFRKNCHTRKKGTFHPTNKGKYPHHIKIFFLLNLLGKAGS